MSEPQASEPIKTSTWSQAPARAIKRTARQRWEDCP